MTELFHIILSAAQCPVFEGEGDGSTGSNDSGNPPADGGGAGAGDAPKGEFTPAQQEKINTLLAAEKRRYQANQANLTAEIEALKAKSKLTNEERGSLDQRVEKLKEELFTKEELAAKQEAKLKRQHEEALGQMTAERDDWKNRFTSSTINAALVSAASANDAYNDRQIVSILGPHTTMEPVLDEDKQPTGQLAPIVRLSDVDKDGKPITLTLSPDEAVKGLKEKSEFLNLFRGEGVGGLGGNTQRKVGGKADLKALASNAAEYRKARADGTVNFNR
jgi:hypothetical protein